MANTTGLKYGGRQKGTPNRLTKELRTISKKNVMLKNTLKTDVMGILYFLKSDK